MTFDLETLAVTDTHKAVSAYIKRETGKAVKPEMVALVQTLATAYRKDPANVQAREAAKNARAAEKAAVEEKKRRRAQERLDRLEAQRVRLLKQLGQDPEAVTSQTAQVLAFPSQTPMEADPSDVGDEPDTEDEESEEAVVLEAEDAFTASSEDDDDDDPWTVDDDESTDDEEDY